MLATPNFDAGLLRRYDRPGPRYTSYPTAPQFSPDFDEHALREAARESNGDPIPRLLSIYVHVPFCLSPCFYCGCNRIITRDRSRAEPYLARLYREIAMTAAMFDRDREVVQLHFGGGTPNFLSPAQLRDVVDTLAAAISISPTRHDRDLSIELDPRSLSPSDVAELATIGFNRASLGVQDFDPAVQAAVNRVQTVEETLAIIEACRRYGLRSVNVDLIYGLPKQTLEGFAKTLDTVIAARPDRLAVYSYAHLPAAVQAAAAHRRGRSARAGRRSSRSCNWRSRSSRRPATSTSAWTTSRCRTTTSRWRRREETCIATSWATRRTPTATSSASA